MQGLTLFLVWGIISLLFGQGCFGPDNESVEISAECAGHNDEASCNKTYKCKWNLDLCMSEIEERLPNLPKELADNKVKKIAAGNGYACFLSTEGKLWCITSGYQHFPSPHPTKRYIDVAVTKSITGNVVCAIDEAHDVHCFRDGMTSNAPNTKLQKIHVYNAGQDICGIDLDNKVVCQSDNGDIKSINIEVNKFLSDFALKAYDVSIYRTAKTYCLVDVSQDKSALFVHESKMWDYLGKMDTKSQLSSSSYSFLNLSSIMCRIDTNNLLKCYGDKVKDGTVNLKKEGFTREISFVDVSTEHVCVVAHSDGTITCDGALSKGQDASGKKAKAVAAGEGFTCFIDLNDRPQCVGNR